ncbi:winged helix-turn-helix domain-containing protein [Methanosarcina acetivorans]|uniref:Transcriptional regulator, ArsR family n=1 Tax=Methanosarcina acetivorans (strain ATCC 35395 / DSM 2834 / JCM 12185 / C2A) TaxID=188937 RepID=Q8TTD3_METAC|nr:winged helix-turn-helix domain-containing protein [Methanosarcina acetivorans]AAM03948.1 transcriptional regulator, ArsR family [Methanosarcina acetivorans C2A]
MSEKLHQNRFKANDNEILKAILSDTRLKILKNLNKRRMTVAELVNNVGVQKNAIYKHLDKLTSAGLVDRVESSERKWVYYELTSKGKKIISTGKYQVLILLSSGIGSLIIGSIGIVLYFLNEVQSPKTKGLEISGLDIGIIFIAVSIIMLLAAKFVSRRRWKKINQCLKITESQNINTEN